MRVNFLVFLESAHPVFLTTCSSWLIYTAYSLKLVFIFHSEISFDQLWTGLHQQPWRCSFPVQRTVIMCRHFYGSARARGTSELTRLSAKESITVVAMVTTVIRIFIGGLLKRISRQLCHLWKRLHQQYQHGSYSCTHWSQCLFYPWSEQPFATFTIIGKLRNSLTWAPWTKRLRRLLRLRPFLVVRFNSLRSRPGVALELFGKDNSTKTW